MKRICLICAAALLLFGCSTNASRQTAKPVPIAGAAPQSIGKGYVIAPGDVLSISVYGEKDMDQPELVVRPDGKVTFPLVGDIAVGGLTTSRVKQELDIKLHKYIPEAVATVTVKTLGSLQYYVVGKVNKPGMFDVSMPMTVLQALAMAGGLTTFADEKHIEIIRNQNGKVTKLRFNYKEVKNGENLGQDIVLQRGDTIVVP